MREGPFIIYTAGRSRTAWLSAFLNYGDYVCHNEMAVTFRDLDQVKAFFSGKVGSAETGAVPGWRLVEYLVPGIKTAVILREPEDVVASFARSAIASFATIDEARLRKIIAYENRCLQEVAARPDVFVARFEDLESEDVCRRLFEHCLPYPFDRSWWRMFRRQNIQSDAASVVRYYLNNKDGVEGFKRLCKRQLIAWARSGAIRKDAHAFG